MKYFFLLLSFLPLLAAGTQWNIAPEGNDGNAGTAEQPLRTILTALGKAAPGDTIKLAPGIYREALQLRKSGRKDAPISLIGTRGAKGEFLSVIEAPGKVLTQWEAAPEIAPGVWKTPLEKRPELLLMDGLMIALVNKPVSELPRWKQLPAELDAPMVWDKIGPECKRLPGLDLLALPHDIRVAHPYFGKRRESLWEVLGNVLACWRKGVLYVRLADNSKPGDHLFTASSGSGFLLAGASYWNFSDLSVRGSRCQFNFQRGCTGNKIENCLLMQGSTRIQIAKGVSDTLIRNNILTAGFIQSEHFKLRSAEDMRGGLLYIIFKYIIGVSSSDDKGILDCGTGTKMFGNVIMRGLIGINAYGKNCEFAGNAVREMSSIGIATVEGCIGRFHDNLVMNCGIPLRLHHFRHTRDKREEYHYNNLFIQAPHGGSMIWIHCESERFADRENFDPKTKKYKQDPPDPVDGGKFYIYHNTFRGGSDTETLFATGAKSRRFRMSLPFFFMNNIMKYTSRQQGKERPRYAMKTQDGLAGNLFYYQTERPAFAGAEEAEVAKFNRIIGKEAFPTLWSGKSTGGLPDLTLRASSPAAGCGVDLSKPQIINGKTIPALPGMEKMKPKPDAGALQLGESQQKFLELHKKAEEAVRMIRVQR